MADLAYLMRKVYTRLRDFSQESVVKPEELRQIINEGLDRFTRDTEYLVSTIVLSLVASQAIYKLAAPGYRLGRVISLKMYDGSRDNWPILPRTVTQMDNQLDYDWRNNPTGDKPWYYIRNYDPSVPLGISKDSVWLYPIPSTAYTNGLRATCVFVTDNFLQSDTDELPVPERLAEEAIINYATAEVLTRLSLSVDEDTRKAYLGLAEMYKNRYESDAIEASVEAKTGYDRADIRARNFFS